MMSRTAKALLGALWLAVALAACHPERIDPSYLVLIEQQGETPATGELGPGDKFKIRVFGEEELSGEFTVSADGFINFPYVGRVLTEGRTCADVEQHLTQSLQQGYVRSPAVSCTIVEYNSKRVFVFGQVQKPGSFAYQSNMTLIEAFALAGGFSERANGNDTKLTRTVNDVEIQVRLPLQEIVEGRQRNLRLLPGDVVYIPESRY